MSPFFDTNVLVYADDSRDPRKAAIARDLLGNALQRMAGTISTQVLQEFFVTVRRKLAMPPEEARARVERFAALRVISPDAALVLAAIDLHRLDGISLWDALVVRSAQRAGCDVLYSEDLQHGRRYDGMQVVDPFR